MVNPGTSRIHFGPEFKGQSTDQYTSVYCDPSEFMPKEEDDDDKRWRWPVVSPAYIEEVSADISKVYVHLLRLSLSIWLTFG